VNNYISKYFRQAFIFIRGGSGELSVKGLDINSRLRGDENDRLLSVDRLATNDIKILWMRRVIIGKRLLLELRISHIRNNRLTGKDLGLIDLRRLLLLCLLVVLGIIKSHKFLRLLLKVGLLLRVNWWKL
jgi:hypothetical protein